MQLHTVIQPIPGSLREYIIMIILLQQNIDVVSL